MDKMWAIAKIIRLLVRPVLSISFGTGALWLTVTGKLDAQVVGTAATAIIAFHFGERSALKGPEVEDK